MNYAGKFSKFTPKKTCNGEIKFRQLLRVKMENSRNRDTYKNIARICHVVLSVFLAVFFIYSGAKKFIPKPASKQISNETFIKAFQEDKFENPVTFRMAIKALRVSGFLRMVGVLQILSGIFILIPPTRLLGLLLLLPLTINIFCMHLFMDNRPGENIETGSLLLLNVILALNYYRTLKLLVIRNWSLNLFNRV